MPIVESDTLSKMKHDHRIVFGARKNLLPVGDCFVPKARVDSAQAVLASERIEVVFPQDCLKVFKKVLIHPPENKSDRSRGVDADLNGLYAILSLFLFRDGKIVRR